MPGPLQATETVGDACPNLKDALTEIALPRPAYASLDMSVWSGAQTPYLDETGCPWVRDLGPWHRIVTYVIFMVRRPSALEFSGIPSPPGRWHRDREPGRRER